MHDCSEAVQEGVKIDLQAMGTFNRASWESIQCYVNNPDNSPHMPPAMLMFADQVMKGLAKVAEDAEKQDINAGAVQRDIIVQTLVTGMLMGVQGISPGMLTQCDCHRVSADSMLDDLSQFLKSSTEEGKSDGC